MKIRSLRQNCEKLTFFFGRRHFVVQRLLELLLGENSAGTKSLLSEKVAYN